MHGANLCYTPMIHAALFSTPSNTRYRREQFDLSTGEEGSPPLDRPVIAQFCANDKETFLQAAMRLAEDGRVDAVDLNLGCPQGIAKRGQYGAFLMEDWALIESLSECIFLPGIAGRQLIELSTPLTPVNHLHKNLSVPITAKFRVYDSLEKTLDYARMLERAGAQILTVHGRTRAQKGQLKGLAAW
jgi:tRNA-dihydrouridine synthase 1